LEGKKKEERNNATTLPGIMSRDDAWLGGEKKSGIRISAEGEEEAGSPQERFKRSLEKEKRKRPQRGEK